MEEIDNYNFGKVMMVFITICVLCFGAILLLGYLEGDGISYATYPEGFPDITQTEYSGATRTDSNNNTGYIDKVETQISNQTFYTIIIDDISSIAALDTNRETDDEWIINKTRVGSVNDYVTLVEYMRSNGTTYEVII